MKENQKQSSAQESMKKRKKECESIGEKIGSLCVGKQWIS